MPKREAEKRKKVLIIEDDPDVSSILAVLLEGLKALVITADDGNAGVSAALREKPDLVLVDLNLPGISGLDVIRSLRATETLATTPIVVITGNSTVENIRETARLGANDFLVKANVLAGAGIQRIQKYLEAEKPEPGKLTPPR